MATTYIVFELDTDGWVKVGERARKEAAEKLYAQALTSDRLPAAVRLATGTGKVLQERAIENAADLSDAQCIELARMAGDHDLVAELEEQARLEAEKAQAQQRKPSTRAKGTGEPRSQATFIPQDGPCKGIKCYPGGFYILAQRVLLTPQGDSEWRVVGWTNDKKVAHRMLQRAAQVVGIRRVLEQSFTQSGSGIEIFRATFADGERTVVLDTSVKAVKESRKAQQDA
ncbi:hypothetical protein [Frankia sp. AvcI1]|uniref:hypothetical protein n=2 Tax=Frankia sp. AvcI1 TaxID=573496 RepID=UPI0021188F35|nr:hypothetical protein [Frankia sp. AvcI1]